MYSILLNVVSCICLLFVYFWKEGISGLCTSVPYMLFWHHLPLVIQCFAFGFGHSVQCLVSLQISSYSVALWSQIDSLKESLNLTFSQWEKSSFPLCTFPGWNQKTIVIVSLCVCKGKKSCSRKRQQNGYLRWMSLTFLEIKQSI